MALIRRIGRLFRADFHAVLDRVEEPEILLRQAIREMEEDIARDQQQIGRYQRQCEQLDAKALELERLRQTLNEQLEACFEADNEDLARPLMRRRLETERTQQGLDRRREQLSSVLQGLSKRLDDHRAQLDGTRQKAELYDRQARDEEPLEPWAGTDLQVRDEDVEVALLQARRQRTGR